MLKRFFLKQAANKTSSCSEDQQRHRISKWLSMVCLRATDCECGLDIASSAGKGNEARNRKPVVIKI
jgi:hypothetical protein